MAKATASVRPHKRTFYVPFGPKDKEPADYARALIEHGVKLKKIDKKIADLKVEKAPIQKEFDKAEEALILGKAKDIECSELFVHDANEVWIRRNDNGEIVERRDMTDSDREMNAFDGTEEVELPD